MIEKDFEETIHDFKTAHAEYYGEGTYEDNMKVAETRMKDMLSYARTQRMKDLARKAGSKRHPNKGFGSDPKRASAAGRGKKDRIV